ncbi:MAG: hypothetical protein WBG67_12975, partial [Thermoanaerobaculia bacterium]
MQRNGLTILAIFRGLSHIDGSSIRRGVTHAWQCAGVAILVSPLVMIGCASPAQPGHHLMHPRAHHAEPGVVPQPIGTTPVLDLGTLSDLETLIPALAEKRVVLIGET